MIPSEYSENETPAGSGGYAGPTPSPGDSHARPAWSTAAERELERVHRDEVAALLRQASALCVARLTTVAPFPLRRPSLRLWRRRVHSTLQSLAAEGWKPEGVQLLTDLADAPLSQWPSAVRIARGARRAEDSEFGRVCLGYALIANQEPAGAERLFARLLRLETTLRHRWRVLEGLALAHAALGRPRLALGAIEAAADEPLCGISTLVNGLHLALIAGDAERVQRAAARLDLLADPYSPEFSAAVGHLRNRLLDASACTWRPDDRTRSLFHGLLREGRSAAGRVCRALT